MSAMPSHAPSAEGDDRHADARLVLFEEAVLRGDQGEADTALRLLDSVPGEDWAWAILTQVDDLVIVCDERAVVRWASPSSMRILGRTPAEMRGLNGFDLIHPDDLEEAIEALMKVRPPESVDEPRPPSVLRVRRSDGRYRRLSVQGTNLLGHESVRGIVLSARDVTERQAAQDAVAQSERRFRALVQGSSDVITLTDGDGEIRYSSPAVERMLGLGPTDRLGSLVERLHADDGDRLRALVAGAKAHPGATSPIEVRLQAADGTWRWLELVGRDLSEDPDVEGVVLNGRDVTDRRSADEAMAEETALLEAIATGASLVDVLRRIGRLLERSIAGAKASVGVLDDDGTIRHRAAPSLAPDVVRLLDAMPGDSDLGHAVRKGRGAVVFRGLPLDHRWGGLPTLFERQDLQTCWCWPVVEPGTGHQLGLLTVFLGDDRGPHPGELPVLARAEHLAAIAIQRARLQAKLEHQARHDSLTDLPNRTLLLERIGFALDGARTTNSRIAVLFVDVDRFKLVNDSLGHAAGDELLDQVAGRFAAAIRVDDTVGRFGGDEFVVCARVDSAEHAMTMARRLLQALDEPVTLTGAEVFASCSIGIAVTGAQDDLRDPEALIRDADAAMYVAKEGGRNRAALFEPGLHRRVVRRLQLERDLRTAIADDRLVTRYQPRVLLTNGQVSGVEALVRWDRPGHGLVGADQVVPVAEETGLIVPIGAWVLRDACREAAGWTGRLARVPVSVNLSARQLADPDLVEVVARTLQDTGLPPERLCLEVTESALAADPDQSAVVLGALKLLGVRLAIDDFGTGYATLDYVRRFSMADELKIDRSFVPGAGDDTAAAIVSAVIVLAAALDFTVVAEGVEDREQVDALRRLGCEHAQGYYFAQPLTPDELRAFAD